MQAAASQTALRAGAQVDEPRLTASREAAVASVRYVISAGAFSERGSRSPIARTRLG